MSNNSLFKFEEVIDNYEKEQLQKKDNQQNAGVVYTPIEIVDFIVKNILKIYIKDQFKISLSSLEEDSLLDIQKNQELKNVFKNIKILDPACGTGRFLISVAGLLARFSKILHPEISFFDLKKYILQENIFGVEIDFPSYVISKLRLISWLYEGYPEKIPSLEEVPKTTELVKINEWIDALDIELKLYNLDFLLKFKNPEDFRFDMILGNPPYVENKKIKDQEMKKNLKKTFKSAFKLYDLSIIFLEKSLDLLKESDGFLSFIIPNKFLAADYGIKIRKIMIEEVEIKEIINISSLGVFKRVAIYPIIITLKKNNPIIKNQIKLINVDNLKELLGSFDKDFQCLSQDLVSLLPANVIPLSGKISLVDHVFPRFKAFSDTFKDLKIIYRPYGFLGWAKHFDNIRETKTSEGDLILLGTGNVGEFHVRFNKHIKIAKKDLKVSYFKYGEELRKYWKDLSNEKIILREIAKKLTCVYDPGNFTNITGLYFISIPSLDTNELFCLMTILNSSLMDHIFKTLFGTLHMSGGFLRFNGSFIKKLPMPNWFPLIISHLGKILQFLSQLLYELQLDPKLQVKSLINHEKTEKFLSFFQNIANNLIYLLYLKDFFQESDLKFNTMMNLLKSTEEFPSIEVKQFKPRFELPKFECYTSEELVRNINIIISLYKKLATNNNVLDEIDEISEFLKV